MEKVILKIDGMSCSACSSAIEKYLNKQDGVKASVNLIMQEALIEYDENKVTLDDLNRFINDTGYKSLGVLNNKIDKKKNNQKYLLIIFGILLIILMYISMSNMIKLPIVSFIDIKKYPSYYGISLLILSIIFIIYGFDIIKNGFIKIIHKSPNMNSLVTIGVISSFIYSLINLILVILGNKNLIYNLYFESVSMIIYFVKLGRFIENINREKTKEAIQGLVQITPEKALLKKKDEILEITIDEVKKGDILICKPGMKIAVDGVITKGSSHLDESFLTGESKTLKKTIDNKVLAGSLNIDGVLEYKALKIGKDSMISEIVRLVSTSINTKSPIERITDKVSSYFVPLIIIIAILTFIIYLIIGKSFNEALITFVTILVVSCPCALGLGAPLAIISAVGKCAKEGILVKTSETLENIYKIDTIVFDKTGTLTYGDLRISRLANYSDYGNTKLLNIVASLESNSIHPIASAFKNYENRYEVSDFKNIPGIGLYGKLGRREFYVGNNKLLKELEIENNHEDIEKDFAKLGNSILYVIENKKIIGIIGVKDIIRKNTKKVIENLKGMNKKIIILSGDNIETANIISKSLGIDNVIANLLPIEKEKYLKELKTNSKVMMIGDGINDALSIATSNVGVSINSGSDISKNSSDVILLNDDLSKIINLINISKKTIKIIKENLFWAFFYNIIMISIAIGIFKSIGISISPSIASIMMSISSLTVVLNSLRLRR